MKKYAVVEGQYPIMPENIKLPADRKWALIGTFGHRETEEAALFILEHCREKGSWVAFTHEELDEKYAQTPKGQRDLKYNAVRRMPLPPGTVDHAFWFYDLYNTVVILGDDGKFRVTDEFIHRCFRGFRP